MKNITDVALSVIALNIIVRVCIARIKPKENVNSAFNQEKIAVGDKDKKNKDIVRSLTKIPSLTITLFYTIINVFS